MPVSDSASSTVPFWITIGGVCMAGPGQGSGQQPLEVPRPIGTMAEPEDGPRHRHLAKHELPLEHCPRVVPHPDQLHPPGLEWLAVDRLIEREMPEVDLAPEQLVLHLAEDQPRPGQVAWDLGLDQRRQRRAVGHVDVG